MYYIHLGGTFQPAYQEIESPADVDSHEAGNDLSDHAPVGVATDQIVVVKRIKRQIVNKVLHAGIKAVMARLVTVQPDVRNVMRAKRSRHPRLHTGPDHINVISVKFHVAAFNVDDPPILPAIPLVDTLIIPDAHGAVKEQRSADEVHAIEDHAATKVQIKDIFVGNGLRLQFFQSVLKRPAQELVIAQRDHDRQVAGDHASQQGRKQAHLGRANGRPHAPLCPTETETASSGRSRQRPLRNAGEDRKGRGYA